MNLGLDCLLKSIARKVCKIVVSKILELKLVGGAFQTGGISGGNNGVSQLPDLANGILECAVAIDHDFNTLAGLLQEGSLDRHDQVGALSGEQLDGGLGGLVGAQQAVLLVVAVAVNGLGQDVVQAADSLSTGSQQQTLGTCTGVDVAGQDVLGVGQDCTAVICEDDLSLSAFLTDQIAVVLDIVNAGEGVDIVAKQLTVLFFGQGIGEGVDFRSVQLIEGDQLDRKSVV